MKSQLRSQRHLAAAIRARVFGADAMRHNRATPTSFGFRISAIHPGFAQKAPANTGTGLCQPTTRIRPRKSLPEHPTEWRTPSVQHD